MTASTRRIGSPPAAAMKMASIVPDMGALLSTAPPSSLTPEPLRA
jgi:hypothetical protein